MSILGVDLLTLLSAAALAFSVLVYVLLDGTDLGVGMLMAAHRRAEEREVLVLTILPIWDANETWLVLGGGGLLALFPTAYAVLLPALYVPLLLMFMGLILLAAGLEFREHLTHKRWSDAATLGGSLLATLCQGLVLGTLIQGVPHYQGQYSGDGKEWLAPFPLFCALALVVGYLWLGACWLYWRTDGTLQVRAKHQARLLCGVAVLMLVAVLLLTMALGCTLLAAAEPGLGCADGRGGLGSATRGILPGLGQDAGLVAVVVCPGRHLLRVHAHADRALPLGSSAGTDPCRGQRLKSHPAVHADRLCSRGAADAGL